MIATETIVPTRKLKIKFSTKTVEVNPGTKCGLDQKVDGIDHTGLGRFKEKLAVPGSNKRGPVGSCEGHKEKRQKIDRKASLQCANILKSLMSHPYGWVFSKPVDPVALNIPDYFSIISEPMDLGTVKSKLEKNVYSEAEEFAADVKLTFANAMRYNPPGNDVHLMAKELNKFFERRWIELDKKWKNGDDDIKCMAGANLENVRKTATVVPPVQKDILPRKSQLPKQKIMQRSNSLTARDDKVQVSKASQIPCKLILKNFKKGSKGNGDGDQITVSVRSCTSSSPVGHKSSNSDDTPNQGFISSDSTGSSGAVSALDSDRLCPSSPLMDHTTDSSSVEVNDPFIDVPLSPKKALRAAILKRRFADTILKARQKTLLDHRDKADNVKLQQEKERLERIQREERIRIEAQIRAAESAARMRAQEELNEQRQKERDAARMAIQKVERTVDIEHNLEILKELEMLVGCTLYGSAVESKKREKSQLDYSLERFGLFIKDEFKAEDDDEDEFLIGNLEEGQIVF